ncbi:WD40 repeat domain-containing protein [Streptomyces sp. NPDC059837]|uniref:WD40 repeat domain-containing protein n=1 Tax=unclassified Streptomyces TaxID=2593676 RepID=UPI0036553959
MAETNAPTVTAGGTQPLTVTSRPGRRPVEPPARPRRRTLLLAVLGTAAVAVPAGALLSRSSESFEDTLPPGAHRATLTDPTSEPIVSVAFSPDGSTLATGALDSLSTGDTLRLWDVAGRGIATTLAGQTGDVESVAFSPDGRTLAIATGNAVLLWNVASGTTTATLVGHTDEVDAVAFSPDGKTLATSGFDGTVRLWAAR